MKQITKNYLNQLNIKKVETLDDITLLIQAHLANFAFASTKVLLKEEIPLELESIYNNIVVNKRGGYCFEHNKLFFEVLKDLGFDVKFYLARVVNNGSHDVPQTHRFTLLKFNKKNYLVDVGIGFRSPTGPILFSTEVTTTPLGQRYYIKTFEDNTYALVIDEDEPFILTTFDLKRCSEADFEMGHFYSHKHPCAAFVNNLVISLFTNREIRSLRNSDYIKLYKDHQEEITIESLEQFSTILKEELNLNFTANEVQFFYENYVQKRKN